MAAMAEDLDACIGNVLKKLSELGIAENTCVIYMSDNGGRTQTLKGGKGTVDEGGLRVPLIVTGPGIKGGVYCDVPAVGYDLLATVLDLAAPGFALPKGGEGGSWKPVLLNGGVGTIKRPIDRLVFHHAVEVEHPQTAMRKGDLKLVYYWDTKESFLYDLKTDLSEKNNLAKEKADVTAQLLVEMQTHVRGGLGEAAYDNLPNKTRAEAPPGGEKGKGKKKGPGVK
jgi:arylsulfatase A-like enzyme